MPLRGKMGTDMAQLPFINGALIQSLFGTNQEIFSLQPLTKEADFKTNTCNLSIFIEIRWLRWNRNSITLY